MAEAAVKFALVSFYLCVQLPPTPASPSSCSASPLPSSMSKANSDTQNGALSEARDDMNTLRTVF